MNDILKIKIIRDFEKINSSQSFLASQQLQILNIPRYKYNSKYLNLLELIKNDLSKKVPFHKKLSLSDLNNMNLDLFEEICKYQNIQIVMTPRFETYYIENRCFKTRIRSVGDHRINVREYVKSHQNNMFYIYHIDENYARWCSEYDNNLVVKNRKLKLENLEKINIEI